MRTLIDLTPCRPAYGLAIEEALLESVRQDGVETIRLWVNDRAIVVGRSQSVLAEVDVDCAAALDVPIVRRVSGGGTVIHGEGNLNLSIAFRTRGTLSDAVCVFRTFGDVLARALQPLVPDLKAEDNGLYIDGLKVGGAAQARRGSAILYHTTVLVSPPKLPMASLLLAMKPGYNAPGVASRPRAVTALSNHVDGPLSLAGVGTRLIEAVGRSLSVSTRVGSLTEGELARAAVLAKEKYGSRAWNHKH